MWRILSRSTNPLARAFHSRRIPYTPPLEYGKYGVTPARKVPPEIPRPGYVGNPDYRRHNLALDPIRVHSPATLSKMAAAGQLAAKAVQNALKAVKEGMTTDAIDEIVHNTIIAAGAYPSPIDYYGFPKSVCTSVNEIVVHGIPDLRPLESGDYVNVDVTCYLNGVHGDSSGMALVGKVHPDVVQLVTHFVSVLRMGACKNRKTKKKFTCRSWTQRKCCIRL